MKDGIIAQSGNSRYLKSVANFLNLYPTYEAFAQALIAGNLPIDLNGVNPAGWQQIGTLLSKANLLSDDTETAIWGSAADRTPNDAFDKVSELYQHWWRVLHGEAYSYYEDVKTPITTQHRIHTYGTTPPTTYSKEISIDASGNITLVNPEEIYGSLNGDSSVISFMQKLTAAAPCYVLTEGGALAGEMLFYIPAGATYSSENTNASEPYTIVGRYYEGSHYIYLNSTAPNGLVASVVTTQLVTVPAGETTYVHSPDRNAYPDGGTVDGLIYKYLGVPFENARDGTKSEATSYNGTGVVGSSNPNILTFDFVPKIIFIVHKLTASSTTSNRGVHEAILFPTLSFGMCSAGGSYFNWNPLEVSVSGTTVSWYYTGGDDEYQMNTSGRSYLVVAIG